jgi:hypothetical protein
MTTVAHPAIANDKEVAMRLGSRISRVMFTAGVSSVD